MRPMNEQNMPFPAPEPRARVFHWSGGGHVFLEMGGDCSLSLSAYESAGSAKTTNAVVRTIISLSMNLFLFRAATAPRTTPVTSAMPAAIRPSLALTFIPSQITSITSLPLCLSEGPKSNFVTISLR